VSAPLRVVAFGLRRLDGVEGGIETHARELYPRLAAAGYDVTVLTRPRRGEVLAGATAQCKTLTLWAPRSAALETLVHSLLCTLYCLWTRPDIVHIHAIGPAICTFVLKAARLRVVLTHHGRDYDAEKWSPLVRSMLRLAERVGVRRADHVICVSDALRGDIEKRFAVRAQTIYNGIHALPPTPPAAAGLRTLVPGSYILMVGRITAHKRVLDVISAMDCSAFADTPLVICGALSGADPNVAAVRAVAARQSNVHLAGFVAPRDLPWLYANARCTVMASSYEGMPFAVLEALGAGSAVLLSDIPAHRELALAEDRYFPVADHGRIRTSLARLLREPWSGPQAATFDARFDWSAIAHSTGAAYRAATARLARPIDSPATANDARSDYIGAAACDSAAVSAAEGRLAADRQAAGGMPVLRLNARLKAASDS
jgi:glycosyltransferase involved in cell wall biosynthesis